MKIDTVWPGGLVEIPWLEEESPVVSRELQKTKPTGSVFRDESTLDRKPWWQNYLNRIRQPK